MRALLDRAACERFIAAYRADGGTAPASDDDLLVPLMRALANLPR